MIPNVNTPASASTLAPSPSGRPEGLSALASPALNTLAESAAPASPAQDSASATALSASKENPGDPKEAQELADRISELLAKDTNMAFRFDLSESNEVRAFQLVDRDTNEVIMQYPSKEALALRDRLEAAAKNQASRPAGPPLASGLLLSTRA